MLDGQTVFVTGAGGFVGPEIVKALVGRGARVHALLGPPGEVARTVKSERVKNVYGEITDARLIAELAAGADTAVHLAGPASVSASFEFPADYARIHVAGAAAAVAACRTAGVRRFIHISSAEVYGRTDGGAVSEDHPLDPRSPYGAAKAGAEQMVRTYARTFGMNCVILRPFSVYGPDAAPYSLIKRIVRMAQSADAVILHDLTPVRDYCHVQDFASAVLRVASLEADGMLTFNVGTGEGTSVADLAAMILRLMGRVVPVREGAEQHRPGDCEIYRLIADTTRASEVLGWRPSISLECGLKHTLEGMSQH